MILTLLLYLIYFGVTYDFNIILVLSLKIISCQFKKGKKATTGKYTVNSKYTVNVRFRGKTDRDF